MREKLTVSSLCEFIIAVEIVSTALRYYIDCDSRTRTLKTNHGKRFQRPYRSEPKALIGIETDASSIRYPISHSFVAANPKPS